jgi:hypothetical protein
MQQLVRFIWALAYLPRSEVVRAWESAILVKVKDVLYDMKENISNNTERTSPRSWSPSSNTWTPPGLVSGITG